MCIRDRGTPVEYLARTILYGGFTQGKWTPDAALLMGNVVMSMIIAIGYQAGVKDMTIMNPDTEEERFLDQFVEDDDFMASIEQSSGQVDDDNTESKLPDEFTGLFGAQF